MRCDFCSAPAPEWKYPAKNFLLVGRNGEKILPWVQESVGDWAACGECHALIEDNHRAELTERSWKALVEEVPYLEEFEESILHTLKELHEMFFANRVGEGERI